MTINIIMFALAAVFVIVDIALYFYKDIELCGDFFFEVKNTFLTYLLNIFFEIIMVIAPIVCLILGFSL